VLDPQFAAPGDIQLDHRNYYTRSPHPVIESMLPVRSAAFLPPRTAIGAKGKRRPAGARPRIIDTIPLSGIIPCARLAP
jgi:hypothetical protein